MTHPMITVDTIALRNAVAIACNAVERTSTLPILGHLLCEPSDDGAILAITGTDLTLTVRAAVPVGTDLENPPANARFTMPAAKLHAALKSACTDKVSICVGDRRTTLSAGRTQFHFSHLPPEDFPEPKPQSGHEIVVPGPTLRELLEATWPAAPNPAKEARHYLCGVLMEHKETELHMIATDGYRMHVTRADIDAKGENTIIVPKSSAAAICRLLSDIDVNIRIGETALAAEMGNIRIHTTLLEGRYPDWRRAIPREERGTTSNVAVIALQQAIARCAICSNEHFRTISIAFTAHSDQPGIDISATNQDFEQATDRIDAEIQGQSVTAGFCADYLRQALDALHGETVEISVQSPDAAILRGAKSHRGSEIYAVVMGIRL